MKYNFPIIVKRHWLVVLFISISFTLSTQNIEHSLFDNDNSLNTSHQVADLIQTSQVLTTAATVSVKGEVLERTPTSNLHNSLYGLLPGLTVLQRSGEPGYDAAWLTIRGIGSYNYGKYTVFVDGFQTNDSYFQYLHPSEIERITIFKDAAALSTFGMKGANGVIWITTKRGEVGKPKIKLQTKFGIQQPIHITKPLVSYQYATLFNEAISNDNNRIWNSYYPQSTLNDYQSGNGIQTDWYNEVIRESTPFLTVDMNFSGGVDAAKYFIMGSFTKSEGLYNTQTDDTHSNAIMQQFNIRSNFDFKLFKIFEGKIDLGGRIEERAYPAYNGKDLWSNLERYPSNIYLVKNENNTWTGTPTYPDNPLASIRELGYYSTRVRTLQANFLLKEKLDFILPGLFLTEAVSLSNWTRGSYDVLKNYARYIGDQQQTVDVNTNYNVRDDWGTNQWTWLQTKLIMGYDAIIGLNRFSTALSYLQYVYDVDQSMNSWAGINTKYAFQNIAGKFNYIYDEKYITEFGFAISGSDNYKPGNQYKFYPSLSAAWIVSKESFFIQNPHVNLLKIRGSIGESAYDGFDGPRYIYNQIYDWSGTFISGNANPTYHSGLTMPYIANPEIFAEESLKTNFGIDLQAFDSFSTNLDLFVDKRSKIITENNHVSDVYGLPTLYQNIGKVTTNGVELNLNYTRSVGDIKYQLGTIITYYNDRIDYMAELSPPSPQAYSTGNSIGSKFGYIAEGFYDIEDFNPDGTLNGLPKPVFGEVQPGDIKYKNINGDNIIDEADMTKIGNSDYPKLTYAFNAFFSIKMFELRFLLQGSGIRDINIKDDAYNKVIAFNDNGNAYPIALNRWVYYPEQNLDTRATATYPRLSTLHNNNNYQSSSFWIKNGNFLRLRNVELTFNIPNRLTKEMKIENMSFFVSGINLLTFSRLLKDYNLDPESLSGYPGLKSYNAGLSISF